MFFSSKLILVNVENNAELATLSTGIQPVRSVVAGTVGAQHTKHAVEEAKLWGVFGRTQRFKEDSMYKEPT